MASPRIDEVAINVKIGGQMAGKTLSDLQLMSKKLNVELRNLVPGTEDFIKKSLELKAVNSKLQDIRKDCSGVKQDVREMSNEMIKMSPAAGVFDRLKAGFQGLKDGLNLGVKGFTTLRGAIALSGIGLFLTIIAAVVAYFQRTDEGSKKLEKVMAALGAIFNVLMGRVVAFGKMIVSVFENPGESIKKLAKLIEENLINRVKAFAVIWKAIKSGNLEEFNNGLIQFGTGITDASGKLKNFANGVKNLASEAWDAAEATVELTRRTHELDDAERDLSVINERRKGQIDQLILSTKNQALSEHQRLDALKLAGQIEQQMTDDALRLAQERYNIIQSENAHLGKAGLLRDKHFDKQADAEKELIRIQNESAMLRQTIANKESAFLKDLAEERKKLLEEQRKAQLAYNKALMEAEATLQDLRYDSLEEGLEKRLTKISMSYNDELAVINQHIKDTEDNEKISLEQRNKLIEIYNQQKIQLEKNFNKEIGDVKEAEWEKQMQKELALRNKADRANANLAIVNAEKNSTAMLEARLAKLDVEMQIELQNKELLEEEKALIEAEYVKKSEELYAEHAEKRKALEQEVKDAAQNLAMEGLQAIVDFGAIRADKEIAEADRVKNERIAKLDQELKSKAINQDTYNSQKEKAEREANEKSRQIKTHQAKKEKAVAITMATIDTIQGVVKALGAAPPPINFLLAALTGAAGALNIAKIASTPIPTFARGGVVHGPSHKEGGIAMINRRTGREIGELEGNEIILTGGVTRDPKLRSAASRINQLGGGRTFEAGGVINPLSTSIGTTQGASPQYNGNGQLTAGSDGAALLGEMRGVRQAIERIPTTLKAIVLYSDIEEARDTVEAVRSDASLGA